MLRRKKSSSISLSPLSLQGRSGEIQSPPPPQKKEKTDPQNKPMDQSGQESVQPEADREKEKKQMQTEGIGQFTQFQENAGK